MPVLRSSDRREESSSVDNLSLRRLGPCGIITPCEVCVRPPV
jgi:hypothetical protein